MGYGLKISFKMNDIIGVINHKSWTGIPHIHVGEARIHIAISQIVVEILKRIKGW